MNRLRSLVLVVSAGMVVLLVGGGLAVRVGAAESPYRQAVLFAEVLAQVLDNYVDPVDSERLLAGAYEGMLAGLDSNGAYLAPAELAEWKKARRDDLVGAGFSVLRNARVLQVVAVERGSAAEAAGIAVGDHVRGVDGMLVGDLCLAQSRRLIEGEAGSKLRLEILHPDDSFRREEIDLVRRARQQSPFTLTVDDGIAVLRLEDLRKLPVERIASELGRARKEGARQLLLDLRHLAEGGPRDAAPVAAALFTGDARLRLRDRAGKLLDSIESKSQRAGWSDPVAVLVDGATAGGAEALALLLRSGRKARVFGEATYGLGAEPRLFELDNGSGLLVSASRWETELGQGWHGDGLTPDEAVEGRGTNPAETAADQLRRVLERLRATAPAPAEREAA